MILRKLLFPAITSVRAFSTRHAILELPKSLVALNDDKIKKYSGEINIPFASEKMSDYTEMLWQVLKDDCSLDPLNKALEQYRNGEIGAIFFENFLSAANNENIYVNFPDKRYCEKQADRLVQSNIHNIILLSAIMNRAGRQMFESSFAEQQNIVLFPISHLKFAPSSQFPHSDDVPIHSAKVARKIDSLALLAFNSQGTVVTYRIDVREIVNRLDSQDLDILKKPIFYYFPDLTIFNRDKILEKISQKNLFSIIEEKGDKFSINFDGDAYYVNKLFPHDLSGQTDVKRAKIAIENLFKITLDLYKEGIAAKMILKKGDALVMSHDDALHGRSLNPNVIGQGKADYSRELVGILYGEKNITKINNTNNDRSK